MIAATIVALLVSGATPGSSNSNEIVEPAVLEALAAGGESYVVVVLDAAPESALPFETSWIDAARARVLDNLSEVEFQPVYLWSHVAGMTGFANAAGVQKLASHPLVRRVGVDLPGSAQLDASVAFIGASTAHDNGVHGAGVTVAVIDSGVDSDHPDLLDDIAPGGKHFLQQGLDTGTLVEDFIGHGTSVAGTITSAGVVAAVGVAPGAKVLPIRVIASDGQSFLSDWIAAVDHVVSVAATTPELALINMSLTSDLSFTECGCDDQVAVNMLLGRAIAKARRKGILTLAASGNGGQCGAMGSPACLESAVAVAAVYESDLGRVPIVETFDLFFGSTFGACFDASTSAHHVACFSNSSACNELAAPGYRITAPYLGGGIASWTGTSQAAPHAAGALALMLESWSTDVESCLTALKLSGKPTTRACDQGPTPLSIDVQGALAAAIPFEHTCHGDGGDQAGCSDCPCGNNATAGTTGGCTNSAGRSAELHALGTPRLTLDTLRFESEGHGAGAATLLVSGAHRLPNNPANPCFPAPVGITNLGDGLRCVGGSLLRHGLRAADPDGNVGVQGAGWGGQDAPATGLIAQGSFSAGQSRHFQAIYRDLVHGACAAGLTSTQAVSTTFLP